MTSTKPTLWPSTPELAGVNRMQTMHKDSFKLNFELLLVTISPSTRVANFSLTTLIRNLIWCSDWFIVRSLLDDTYTTFHAAADYPVAKFLQEPVFFEVELKGTKLADVSQELDRCWATLDSDGFSQPRWNLIINGYIWVCKSILSI